MITPEQTIVNKCLCELCGWTWKSLVIPTICTQCGSRRWNGIKKNGKPLKGTLKMPKRQKIVRRELTEYNQEEW